MKQNVSDKRACFTNDENSEEIILIWSLPALTILLQSILCVKQREDGRKSRMSCGKTAFFKHLEHQRQ